MNVTELWKQAQIYINESNFDKALSLLNEAISIEPQNANILSERAVVYFHLEDPKKALEGLNACVELEPLNPYRYSSRAYVRAAMKDVKGAIEDYEKCVQLDPEDAVAYNNLGLLLESQGRIEQAKRNFKKADELEGILNERGISIAAKEEVIDEAKEVKSEMPNEPKNPAKKHSTWSIVKSTFTDKTVFKEYLKFIKNGFKMKSDSNGE